MKLQGQILKTYLWWKWSTEQKFKIVKTLPTSHRVDSNLCLREGISSNLTFLKPFQNTR